MIIGAIGSAGGGKSFTALQYAMERVSRKDITNVVLVRPQTTVGETKPGAYPGDEGDKIMPYLLAQSHNLELITGKTIQDLIRERILSGISPAHTRGCTLDNTIMIIDDAQNFTPSEMKGLLTRLGQNTKIVLTGDISEKQSDIGPRESGLTYLLSHFGNAAKNNPKFSDALAIVEYTTQDSTARNRHLPHILSALDTTPEGYIKVSPRPQKPYETSHANDLKTNFELACQALTDLGITAKKRYESQSEERWPHLRGQKETPHIHLPQSNMS